MPIYQTNPVPRRAREQEMPRARRCPPPGAGRVQSAVPCPGDTGDDTGVQMRPLWTYSGCHGQNGFWYTVVSVYIASVWGESCTGYIAARYCTLQAHLNRYRQIYADYETADICQGSLVIDLVMCLQSIPSSFVLSRKIFPASYSCNALAFSWIN